MSDSVEFDKPEGYAKNERMVCFADGKEYYSAFKSWHDALPSHDEASRKGI